MGKNIYLFGIIFLLLAILLIGTISAEIFTIDNVKSFQKTADSYGIATIRNSVFGIGTSDIMKVELKKNTDFCMINCSAEGTAELYQDAWLLSNPYFKDLDTGKEKAISYQIYIQDGTIKGEQQVKVCTEGKPIYNKLNNSYSVPKECHNDYVTVDIPNWVLYNGEKLKKGKYNWKIEGQKGLRDNIDWIGEFDGVKVTEWAVWQSSFNNGLMGYWSFDDANVSSNLKEDVFGVNNGTNGAGFSSDCKHGNCVNFSGANITSYVTIANEANFDAIFSGGAPFTYSVWAYPTGDGVLIAKGFDPEDFSIANMDYGLTDGVIVYWKKTSDKYAKTGNGVFPKNEWSLITVRYSGTSVIDPNKILISINGVNQSSLNIFGTAEGTIAISSPVIMGYGFLTGIEHIWKGKQDEVALWNRTLTDAEVTDLYNGGAGIFYNKDTIPLITLYNPTTYQNFSSSSITFNGSAETIPEFRIQNVSLWLNGERNYTITNGVTNFSELYTTLTLPDGVYNWTISADDNATITQTGWATNRTFTIDTGAPIVNITSIINTTYTTNYTTNSSVLIELNFSQSDPHLESCWYATNNSVNVSITCGENASVVLPYGTYTFWAYANDTLGQEASYNVTATWGYKLLQNSITYNTTTYETRSENYLINVSTLDSSKLTSIDLIYNNSNVYTTSNLGSGIWRYTLTPTLIGNNTVIFQLTYDGVKYNSSTYYQKVNPILFGLCNSTLTTKYLNISFKDEETNGLINASISSSTFYYYINDVTTNKTLTFSNNTNNFEYNFCSLNNETINIIYSIQYLQGTDYPQRVAQGTSLLTNITTNKTLYLLSSSDGIYVTFQVQNANTEQVINGVDVLGTRVISGEEITVAQGTTDSAGSVTFWLNPDFLHTFNFTKTGYSTYTTSIYPTQTSYTISLTSGSAEVSNDYTKGISYSIKPSGDYLTNNTLYNFNLTINSTYWSLNEFGFYLYYGNGSLIDSISSSSVGTIGINANTLNTSYIKMNFYYTINSTYFNGTRTWYVDTGNNSFSILHFFNDLKLYMSVGFFGIDNFGRVLISIFIIVMVIGGIAIRYGIQNEAMLMGILFGIVYFFDVGVGLIPSVTFGGNSISHFATIAVGLLLAGFLIKEEMR